MRKHLSQFAVLLTAIAILVSAAERVAAQDVVQVFRALRRADAAVQEMRNQKAPEFLKPLVNAELSFIKRVCDPNEEQMKAIVAAAQQAFDAMADMTVEGQANVIARNNVRIRGPNNESLTQNPYTRVRKDAAKYLRPILRQEQLERYLEESKQRDDFERRAAIGIAVGLMDNKLILTEEQREQLTEELIAKWWGVDIQQMQMYLNNPQYAPQIPASSLSKVLTPSQLKLWRSFNSTNFSVHIGHQPQSVLNEDWIK
jgi:hypothetical protein